MTCPLGGESGSVVRLCIVNLEIFGVTNISENMLFLKVMFTHKMFLN